MSIGRSASQIMPLTNEALGRVGFGHDGSFQPLSEGVERSGRTNIIREVIPSFGSIRGKAKAKVLCGFIQTGGTSWKVSSITPSKNSHCFTHSMREMNLFFYENEGSLSGVTLFVGRLIFAFQNIRGDDCLSVKAQLHRASVYPCPLEANHLLA